MVFKIKEARERAGYSQKELAKLIGVAPSTFNGYENGDHDPKSDLLVKIADLCGVTVDFLICIQEERKEPAPISGDGPMLDLSGLSEADRELVRQFAERLLDAQSRQ